MFKKLLTTMLVLAIAVTAGTAMAGDVEWKFYGKLHQSINMLGNGENSQLGITTNTSRFGFKGWAPMNDDMKFVWQFERSLNLRSTGSDLSVRNSYVGVKGEKFGEIRVGRHDTPHKTLGRKTTFFYDTIGDNRQMTFGTDSRESDILAWVSPDWDGFGLFLAYQFDQDSDKLTSNDKDEEFFSETVFSGMASYAKDEFFFGASWLMFSESYGLDSGDAVNYYFDDDGNYVWGDAPMVMRFAGKYTAEKFALAASYLTASGQYADTDADGNDIFTDLTATTIGFEGKYQADERYAFKAGYYMANPNTDAEDDADTAGFDEGDVSYGLLTFGIDRYFSKNVMLYVQYAAMSYGDASGAPDMGDTNGFGKTWNGFYNGFDDDGNYLGYENPYGFSFGATVTW